MGGEGIVKRGKRKGRGKGIGRGSIRGGDYLLFISLLARPIAHTGLQLGVFPLKRI